MGFLSKLISKDDEETDEDKKKKKEKEEDIVYVKVGGEDIPVAKGDMKDDEWQAVVKAAKQDVQPKTGDSIVVKGDDGSDLIIPKGDIDDDAWEQLKKNAKSRGSLVQGDQRDQVRASDIEALPARRGGDVGRTYATDREEEEDQNPRDRLEIGEPEVEKPENPRGRLEIGEPEIYKPKVPRGKVDFGDGVEFRAAKGSESRVRGTAQRMLADMTLGAEEPKKMEARGSARQEYVLRRAADYEEETGSKPTSADIQRFNDRFDNIEKNKAKKAADFKKSVHDEEASIEFDGGKSHNPAVRMAQEMMLGASTEDLPERKGGDVGTTQNLGFVDSARQAGLEAGPKIKEGVKQALGPLYGVGESIIDGGKAAVEGIKAIPKAVEGVGAFTQGVINPEAAAQMQATAGQRAASEYMVPPPPAMELSNPQVAQIPPKDPAVAGVGGSAGMGMSTRISRGGPDIALPKDRTGEMEQAYGDAAKAMRMNADLEAQGLKAKGQAFDAQVNEGIRQKAKLAEIEERKRKEVEKPMSIYNGFMSQLMQPSEKIDPNRWVNSRSTGQKVLLVLGAMFTKGGNVDMIRKAIDADIDAQKSDIAANRDRIKTGLQASQNLVQMARDQGADEVQAAKIAYAVECDIVANRLQMITANTDSQEIKQKADQAIAEMNVQKSKALADMDRYSTDLAIRKAQVQNQYDELQIKRSEAWRKANAPPKQGKGPERIKGAQLEHIANLQTQLKALGKLRADYVSKYGEGGYGTAAYNSVTGLAPTSDAARFNRKGKSIQLSVLAAAQNAGVIQPGEYKRFEKEIATASSPDALNQLDNFIDQISTRLETTLKAFEAGGYNVSGQFSGEAPKSFEADDEEASEE